MANNKSDLFNSIKKKTGQANIESDIGFVNEKSDSSILARDDGSVHMSAGEYAQVKVDKESGSIISNSLSETTNTVIKDINATDITINKHKLNNLFIQLTDFRDVNGNTIGGLITNGTVLVKTWEESLQKWVLIRRPIYTPLFSNKLNIPSTPEQLEVDLDMLEDIKQYYLDKEKE